MNLQALEAPKRATSVKGTESAKTDVGQATANILVIAPHGLACNDKNTDAITNKLALKLGGYVVINDQYRKPDKKEKPDKALSIVDANRINQVKKFLGDEFLNPILAHTEDILAKYGKALVIWVHG